MIHTQTDPVTPSDALLAAAVLKQCYGRSIIPLTLETGCKYSLRSLFKDLSTLPGIEDASLEDNRIIVHAPQNLIGYLRCDPRIERITPRI